MPEEEYTVPRKSKKAPEAPKSPAPVVDRPPNWRDSAVPLAVLGGALVLLVCLGLAIVAVVVGVRLAEGGDLFAISPFEGDAATLEYGPGGVDTLYPADWVVEYSSGQVMLAENQSALDYYDWSAGAMVTILSGSAENLQGIFGGDATSEGLMDAITQPGWFIELGERERRRFDRQEGLGVQITMPDEYGGQGYLATFSDGEISAVVVALCHEDVWEENWPIFEAILDNMAFYEPRPSAERGDLEQGETHSAELDPGGLDAWTYRSSGDEYVSVIVASIDDWDPTLEAFDEDGVSIAFNDDTNYLDPALMSLHLEEAGVYEFRVGAYSGYGRYEITLLAGEEVGGGDLEYGDTATGSLDWSGEREEWRFEGEEGDTVAISMVGQGALYDTYLELYGPDGSPLISNDDGGGGLSSLIQDFRLPEDGEYLIIARAYGSEIGPYEITLNEVQITENPISYGRSADGELTNTTSREYWIFEGEAGDIITIIMEGQGALDDVVLELYSPDGAYLAQGGGDYSGSAEISALLLTQDGDYRIIATSWSGETGRYELLVGPADIQEQRISYGDTEESELTEEQPREYWTFQGREGDVVTIGMEGLGSFSDTYLELYGPYRMPLTQNDDGGEGLFALIEDYELPEDGEYLIVTRGFGGAIGSYELSLTVGQ
jgi:hypothetical protein